MNSTTQTNILTMASKNLGVRDICVATGCRRSEVLRVLNAGRRESRPKRPGTVAAQLLAEGYSAELVWANFGNAK